MLLKVEMPEAELRQLVYEHLRSKLGDVELQPSDIKIQVKSKQNFRSEWEEACFRAVVEKGGA